MAYDRAIMDCLAIIKSGGGGGANDLHRSHNCHKYLDWQGQQATTLLT